MQNLFYVEGKNFSGRSSWLEKQLGDGILIGSEAVNYLSGIVGSVKDEILLHQSDDQQMFTYAFKRKFNFENMWETVPTKLSGGETAILSIFISLLLGKERLHIDNTLEQLNAVWRNELFEFIKDYFPETSVYIADNRFGEYGIVTEIIKPELPNKEVFTYRFRIPNFKQISFARTSAKAKELVIENLHFSYSKKRIIFNGFNLRLTEGIYHLKGMNGAGKSTLSKLLVGIEKSSNGNFFWNKEKILPYKYPGKYCTYATQNPSDQISNTTVETEILGASVRQEERLTTILSAFGLQDLVKINPEELPFTIRKRINLASILYDNKDITIFDEPTLGQDTFFVKEFAMLINRMRLSGKIIIVISHSDFFISQIDDLKTIEIEKK